jgi:hypothetical protein
MYDLISDIHDYAIELKAQLAKTGYQEIDDVSQHLGSKISLLVDSSNRGTEQIETVIMTCARNMIESGDTPAAIGAFEFSAVGLGHLRFEKLQRIPIPTDQKNQVDRISNLHFSLAKVFNMLLPFPEKNRFRIVDSCWHFERHKITLISTIIKSYPIKLRNEPNSANLGGFESLEKLIG